MIDSALKESSKTRHMHRDINARNIKFRRSYDVSHVCNCCFFLCFLGISYLTPNPLINPRRSSNPFIPNIQLYTLTPQVMPMHTEMLVAKAEARKLEISLISGENINGAEKVYVVVRAESLNCCTTKMVNENKGVHAWNEKFTLDVPPHARSVTFEVQSNKYKGFRPIGVARIALSDFLSATANNNIGPAPQTFCYGLRNWEGRRNGVIHFSVKEVTQPDNLCLATKQENDMAKVSPVTGIQQQVMVDQNNPVWWSFQSVVA
ncbi:hypothetical protein VNO78_25320 [Psophocarpus tetragonolobus]|uniref:C2 domain-containing protein n=1 Tax=Psophocarpus tetragonolobus TaxID=3891 RepID=A0AAN9S6X2_PSOTE